MKLNRSFVIIILVQFLSIGCIHNLPPIDHPINDESINKQKVIDCPDDQIYDEDLKRCRDILEISDDSDIDESSYTSQAFLDRAFAVSIKEELPHIKDVMNSYYSTSELTDEIESWETYSAKRIIVLKLVMDYKKTIERFNNNAVGFTDNIQTGLNELTEAAKIAGEKVDGDFKQLIEDSKLILKTSTELLSQEDTKDVSNSDFAKISSNL
ncbi:MAG: hypothetical protein HQK51_19795 [Oligoflexia bacterium]|nr:hypothetical protein [Oligoflexia bacterium]